MNKTADTEKIIVSLGETVYSGDLVMITAVDIEKDRYDGVISSNARITEFDYIALLKTLCEECAVNLKSDEGKEAAINVLNMIIRDKFTKSTEKDVYAE